MSNEKSVTREWQAGAPAKESSAGGAPAPAGAATPAGSPGAAPGRSAGSPSGPGTQPTQAVRSWYTPTTAHVPPPPHDPHAPAEPHSGSTRAGTPGVPPQPPDTELFTRITPGFILESIPREQAVMLSTSRLFPQSAEHAPEEFTVDMSRALARRMLAALPADDLRAVCRRLHLPSEGEFKDLYRRLSLLC
jgi:hypothetical protein